MPGNHDVKLLRKLNGANVQLTHGLDRTVAQLETEPPEFLSAVAAFIDSLVSHYVLDAGKLVVAHAGMKEEMQGRGSGAVREFALFGETTGETDEFGYNIQQDPVHVHDFHATILHLMGLNHEQLVYKHLGRRYRLTDVAGEVKKGLIA